MKKKVLSLLLSCSMVFGMTACQDKAEADDSVESAVKEVVDSAEDKANDVIADASNVFEQIGDVDLAGVVDKALDGEIEDVILINSDETMVSDKMEAVVNKITEYFNAIEEANAELYENGLDAEIKKGAELKLTVSPGEKIAEVTDMGDVKSVGATIDMDIKDPMHNRFFASVQINEDELVKAELIQDEMTLYIGVPEYTDQYLKIDLEEIVGVEKGTFRKFLEEGSGSMLSFKDVKKMWDENSQAFIQAFKYQEKVSDYTIGFEDYEITGDKYVTEADVQDVVKIILDMAEDLSIYPAYGIDLEEMREEMKEYEGNFRLNYIHNSKDEYAWELVATDTSFDEPDSESIVFMSTEKGICLFGIDRYGDKERFLYTVKESDEKGKIVLEQYGEDFMALEYDNLREGHVELSTVPGSEYDYKFTLVLDQDGDDISAVMMIDNDYESVSIEFAGNNEKASLVVTASEDGESLAIVRLDSVETDFDDFEIPTKFYGVEEVDQWVTTFDQQKLMNTLLTLQQKYPGLIKNVTGLGTSRIPDDEE